MKGNKVEQASTLKPGTFLHIEPKAAVSEKDNRPGFYELIRYRPEFIDSIVVKKLDNGSFYEVFSVTNYYNLSYALSEQDYYNSEEAIKYSKKVEDNIKSVVINSTILDLLEE